MKKTINFLSAVAVLAAMLTLSGCMTFSEQADDRYDRGDRISDGVRYVGWCDVHPHNIHCQDVASAPPASPDTA